MSILPESAELADARDAARGRRRGFGFGFWAMMAFAAACLIAAAIVAIVYGVFGAHAVTTTPAPPATAPVTTPAPGRAPPAYTTQTASAPTASAPGEQMATLEGRLVRLEAGQARSLNAAAAALAAASLSEAAAGPRPFANDLAAVERLMPSSPHVVALAPLAAIGAPTRADLAAALETIAARVSIAAHSPAKTAGFTAQLGYALSRVVSIRRVDAVGAGSDAVLARAQRRAADGDLEGAVSQLDTLPGSAREELGDWRQSAQRRIDIDDHIAALRAQALADLSGVAGDAS